MLYLDRHKIMLMNTGMTVYLMLRFYGKFNYSSLRLMKRVYRGYRKRTEDDFINPTPIKRAMFGRHSFAFLGTLD